MIDEANVAGLLCEYRAGHSLPGDFYSARNVYDFEMAAVFGSQWLFACSACEIPETGDYLTLAVGLTSVIVIRGEDGAVRAFHNTCRHRGSRLCKEPSGSVGRLVCPYHQWTYDLHGTLVAAGQMPEDFRLQDWPLKSVHVANVCGLVYICLAERPPDLERFRRTVTPYIAPHEPDRCKVVYESTIVEKANWKLVIENNRECYHCSANHPELLVAIFEAPLSDAMRDSGFADLMARKAGLWDKLGLPHALAEGGHEFRCVRLPFREGVTSMTTDGKPACKKLLGNLTERDLGSVRLFHVPNNWNHFLSDHIIHCRVLPRGPFETELRTTWLVHEDAIEGWDYDPKRLAEVWLATNDQDRQLAEENFLGVQSTAYEPGPYAPVAESMVVDFIDWYLAAMREHLTETGLREAAE